MPWRHSLRGDSERLLRFVAEAESFGGDHPFSGEFLTQLGRLVPAGWISYSECLGCSGDGPGLHECASLRYFVSCSSMVSARASPTRRATN